ncbi:MAG: beta-N-acetylhexosaminidase, partial [Clostridia bacterium]|nr:beta-N-acetylhexosaminidase [Clostridia bacterium]
NIANEGYEIKRGKDEITIGAATDSGAFYAQVTLRQMMDSEGAIWADVKDSPKYPYRGFMLDCSRHFWRKEKIKQLLDVMADVKMNVFHWHLSDDQGWRAEIKKYPLLTQKGTIRRSSALYHPSEDLSKKITKDEKYGEGMFYSQDDMKEIVAYAAKRHIEVVPEIDMPGHMVAAISCYPELSCRGEDAEVSCRYGVMDNICCCGKDATYDFAKDVIDELCEIFPGRYFHIGGDEAPKTRWKQCPDCQKKIKELGLKDENALQGYFNIQIAKYLKSKGKRMIGWNEILDARDIMDKDIVAQWWWKYSVGNKNEKEWMSDGGQCLLSLCPYVYMDHSFSMRPLKKTYSFSARKLTDDDSNVLGME